MQYDAVASVENTDIYFFKLYALDKALSIEGYNIVLNRHRFGSYVEKLILRPRHEILKIIAIGESVPSSSGSLEKAVRVERTSDKCNTKGNGVVRYNVRAINRILRRQMQVIFQGLIDI